MLKLEVPPSGLRINSKAKFRDLKLEFLSNFITILLGPNGGGKTTLLRTILSPSEAGVTLTYKGEYLNTFSPLRRSNIISYVGTSTGTRPRLSVVDFLSFSFYKKNQLNYEQKIEAMLSELGISYLLKSKIDQVSEGEYKRISIANGLLQDAEWYLLDEPEEHLDPCALKNLAKVILKLKQEGKSFLLACHNLSFASYLADHFIGVNSCANIVFNQCKSRVIESKQLEELFTCDFIFGSSSDCTAGANSILLGPKYE